MKIGKVIGGYVEQESGKFSVYSPTESKMATHALKVLRTEITKGLEGLKNGQVLSIDVQLSTYDGHEPSATE